MISKGVKCNKMILVPLDIEKPLQIKFDSITEEKRDTIKIEKMVLFCY